jgi:hypothetical protein
MYRIILLLIVLFTTDIISISAQQEVKHFFINMKSVEDTLSFGVIEKVDGEYVNKYFEAEEGGKDITWDKFKILFSEWYKQMDETDDNLLFYTHGFLAHKHHYQTMINNYMHKHVYEKEDNSYRTIVSLVWFSTMDYKATRTTTIEMGDRFAGLVNELLDLTEKQSPQREVSFLNHSMGNRLFEGVYLGLNKIVAAKEPYIENVIFAAPDIEVNTFSSGGTLENIDEFCDQAIVYRNNRDLTLGMSKFFNKKDRLGLDGITDMDDTADNVFLVDVSMLEDSDDKPDKFTRHRYFTGSPAVRQDMFNTLNPEFALDQPERQILKHERRLVIHDLENEDADKVAEEKATYSNDNK